MAIIDKKTGKIVWKLGPNYDETRELQGLGWIIGQHHAHMIPRGLPGEGNILVFDNGGWAGYGAPNPGSPTGFKNALRDYSRVLEIDPITLKIVWQYTPGEAGLAVPVDANRFYSPFISSAQRLPNGNTLITEGSGGRIIEVTAGSRDRLGIHQPLLGEDDEDQHDLPGLPGALRMGPAGRKARGKAHRADRRDNLPSARREPARSETSDPCEGGSAVPGRCGLVRSGRRAQVKHSCARAQGMR